MIYSPLLVIFALAFMSVANKSKAAFLVAFSYMLNYLFLESQAFDLLQGDTLYIICGIISLGCMLFIRDKLYPAFALALYGLTNLAVAFDYLFYPHGGTIIDIYYYHIYAVVDISLIALCTIRNDNGGRSIRKAIINRSHSMGYLSCNPQHTQRMEEKWNS